MKAFIVTILFFTVISCRPYSEKILLYPTGAAESNELEGKEVTDRHAKFIYNVEQARIYAYPAPKNNNTGTAILILPGGSYIGLAYEIQGSDMARWLNSMGISAFVLYYRMPNGHHEIPLQDAKTALEIIHQRAAEWQIDQAKIGVMGFSAGGHLAASVSTHYATAEQRPAFMILGYPVISLISDTHGQSRTNLIGKEENDSLIALYSNELHVTSNTPRAFIFHAIDDDIVSISHSRNFADSLRTHGIECVYKEYRQGGHGFCLPENGVDSDSWNEDLAKWLEDNHLRD
ncbi:MAG: alpha/beta hydrolase [Paludibacter sp.]|jgi:acetyl esterase/lipase|nr:alpha/beta hydrolase [Paludibacter sp.]